ncbi:MAG: acyl carrier protein [Thermoplasmata archaeon]|nr:acyl carrier protein [Thermoplasmata archaeon]HUR64617.1 acyl carrier protein [Candidatus Thermoplasmatota archaeon]
MDKATITRLMADIQKRNNRPAQFTEAQSLREIGFRSLDFSELLLRLEGETGKNLDMDAAPLRQIHTVGDLHGFILDWLKA